MEERNFYNIGELTQELERLALTGNELSAQKTALAVAQQLAVLNSHLAKIEKLLTKKK